MRAVALAIILAGMGVECAIRKRHADLNIVGPLTIAFLVCLVFGW